LVGWLIGQSVSQPVSSSVIKLVSGSSTTDMYITIDNQQLFPLQC